MQPGNVVALVACLSMAFATAAAAPGRLLELSVSEAIRMALERNPELAVQRYEPEILETDAAEERALFDPLVEVHFGREKILGRDLSSSGILYDYRTDELVGEAKVTHILPTGTWVELLAGTEVADASRDGQQLVESRVGATISQPLLRDAKPAANLARVVAARHEAQASRWELRGLADWIAASVAHAYWDHALAVRQIEVWDEAIAMAEELHASIHERIDEGLVARGQLVAAEAEIALRRQERIDACAGRDGARALVVGILDLYGELRTGTDVRLTQELGSHLAELEALDSHVARALADRPDLNQARAWVRRGEIEIVRTRNGLLPRLDLFVTYGRTGYADSFPRAWDGVRQQHYDLHFGISLKHALGSRDDRADYRRARLEERQAHEAVRNLERLVQTDVHLAHVEALRARDLVAAVAITRALDEQKLQVESERFELGLASSFQVARAQRDLVERRIDEATAVAEFRKALVELHRLDGSLLERSGIIAVDAPAGAER